MKIYTKTGDEGTTGLLRGPRVPKDHPRIEAYGSVDELNAVLGLARCEPLPAKIDAVLLQVQNELFELGAELAAPDPQAAQTATLSDASISALEKAIDQCEANLPELTCFILPAGTRAAALLHLARTVCRRAERRLFTLAADEQEPIRSLLLVYLNRLGDLLFVMARAVNQAAGEADTPWEKPSP